MTETINERIARFRKLSNLTQAETAEKLGIKCSTYSQMERKGKISTDTLMRLSEVLGVSPFKLLYGDDRKEEHTVGSLPYTFEDVPQNRLFLHQGTEYYNNLYDNKSDYIPTRKEENIMKIIHFLPKKSKEEVYEFVYKKYKESK